MPVSMGTSPRLPPSRRWSTTAGHLSWGINYNVEDADVALRFASPPPKYEHLSATGKQTTGPKPHGS